MLYIKPMMLEPTTASIAVYLLAKTPLGITKNRRLILRKPFYVKRKICKWVLYNQHQLIDTLIDEGNDFFIDSLNLIKISQFNPSIFLALYIIALVLVIIF
jgi:hypothetical protein